MEVKKSIFAVILVLACASPAFQGPMLRGFYPGPTVQMQTETYEADAFDAAKKHLYPYWHQIEDSLGFSMATPEYRGTQRAGDTLIFKFFAPAIGDILHKQHRIFAGAFLEICVENDTLRAIYFKELPWE